MLVLIMKKTKIIIIEKIKLGIKDLVEVVMLIIKIK